MYTFIGSFVDSKLTNYYYQYKKVHNISDDNEILNLIEKCCNFNDDLVSTPKEREDVFNTLMSDFSKLIGRNSSFLEYLLSYNVCIIAIDEQKVYMTQIKYISEKSINSKIYNIESFDKYVYLLHIKNETTKDNFVVCYSIKECNSYMNKTSANGYEVYKISLSRPDSRFLVNATYYDRTNNIVYSPYKINKSYFDNFTKHMEEKENFDGWYDFVMRGVLYEKYTYDNNRKIISQGIVLLEQSEVNENSFNDPEILQKMCSYPYGPFEYIEVYYPDEFYNYLYDNS